MNGGSEEVRRRQRGVALGLGGVEALIRTKGGEASEQNSLDRCVGKIR